MEVINGLSLLQWLINLFFRVWDKVISGSCKILVFVALEILLSYKIMLMGITRPDGVVKFLCNVSSTSRNDIHDSCPHARWPWKKSSELCLLLFPDTAGEHRRYCD